ncbi:MAG: COX15/CtaA family protein [Gemmatimonadetes bacterium]|nr:COX15/CtaA family protein [Gemmatimonadota bacterium]
MITYLLIVFGGIVRITGSGMGCGDDWPLCNGQWLPPLDFATWIEWGHRLVAALVSFLVAGFAIVALVRRRREGWARRWRLTLWIVVLLAIQVMLGAITVWLELPPTSVVLHLGTAMALLALLLLGALGAPDRPVSRSGPATRMAWALVGGGAVAVMLGGLVANLDAAPACQGFPLCNGSLFPGGHWRIHVHWTHRVVAYALALGVIALPWIGRVRSPTTAWLAATLTIAQIVVAAIMVLQILPQSWRIAHVALGTAVFAALVAHAHALGGLEQGDVAEPAGRAHAHDRASPGGAVG